MSHYHPVLHNPHWATNEIHGQLMTHRGKSMVCLAFTQREAQEMVSHIRQSDLDYRFTLTSGPARFYEQRKGGTITTQHTDGLWKPRWEREN